MNNKRLWIFWLIVSIFILIPLMLSLFSETKQAFMPGPTIHGHHQIEMACGSCHTDPFGGKEVLQNACMNCHKEDLAKGDDSHPKSKFTDPRNSDTLKKLDARYCIACHIEHQPEITHTMGVTQATDFCFQCHADIADDRISHKGMAFSTCGAAGCHNFHDNTALYEDFLVKHANEPAQLPKAVVSDKDMRLVIANLANIKIEPLAFSDIDAPKTHSFSEAENKDWLMSSHAKAGVNCMECHRDLSQKGSTEPVWLDKPNEQNCQQCHSEEGKGFLAGKHGMRLAAGLAPMQPAMAKQPMRSDADDKELSCVSCHSAHEFNVRIATSESCLNCHNDKHSLAYEESKHAKLWQREFNGMAAAGSGVSCATCHMPRLEHKQFGVKRILVEHNQNQNLRPNEKMIRQVCMSCHGLGFSIDALADEALVESNFNGQPSRHIESIDMAQQRVKK